MVTLEPEVDPTFQNELTYHGYETAGTVAAFHDAYEAAFESVRGDLGGHHRLRIEGEAVSAEESFGVTSPGDRDLSIGTFEKATAREVDVAVRAAAETFESWRQTEWEERVEIVREAAELMADRKFELAALMTLENGKNRTEAVADVDEAIDFMRYYSDEVARHRGYTYDTGEPVPGERCTNVLRPYGVFGVISPFNFPCAILTGMTTGAVITGNTAVVKPAEATPAIAHALLDILESAGLPDGVVNLVTGFGETTGAAIVEHEDVDGIVFTGSRAVGLGIQERFLELGKRGPVIAELGGKNPVIVSETADLEKAVPGVTYGAFGFGGQKCSATSRVYVHEGHFDAFRDRLVARACDIPTHPPEHREAIVSPVIDDDALERYRRIAETAREIGTVHVGGEVVSDADLPDGRYVRPTVVTGVPHDHRLAREEHFLPFVTLHPVADLDEGIRKSNDSEFGLCAGLFSEDEEEIETWFDRIESGMTYVNRARSATTGALVQAQPFGGWKFSGTTGKFAGGRWYLPQFMRQQSRTRVVPTDD